MQYKYERKKKERKKDKTKASRISFPATTFIPENQKKLLFFFFIFLRLLFAVEI